MAQKRIATKKNPATPVFINTASGKHLSIPAMKPVPVSLDKKTVVPRNKITIRNNNVSKRGDFTHVSRKVSLLHKSETNKNKNNSSRSLNIYYPQNKLNANNFTFQKQRKKSTYASITLSSQGDVDNFNTTYPACDEVGTLIIDASDINNLATLNNITGVGAIIIKNTLLTNLSALSSLTSIYDSLVLENNASLTSIGLSNVSTLGGLYIRNSSALLTVDAFAASLTEVGNDVFIENSAVTSLTGLSELTLIGGDLTVSNTPITSLSDLNNLQTVHYLYINKNDQLTNLGMSGIMNMWGFLIESMPQLTSLGSFTQNLSNPGIGTLWLSDMEGLTDISSLDKITTVANIVIYGCQQLADLDGLENITDASYGIFLYNNGLNDISALSGITTVENDKIEIGWNNDLSSLDGLQNITKADALWIYQNSKLIDLNDLNYDLEIYNVNGDDLQIYNNAQLTVCAVPAICNYLNSTNAIDPQIYSNAGSCGDLASVMASCGITGGGLLEDVTWNGSQSEEWNEPLNWTPNKVPDQSSRAIILSEGDYSPEVSNDINIGGLKMSSGNLYLNGYELTIGDSVNIYDSYIEGGGYITMNAANPIITFSYFDIYGLDILNYRGGCYFYNNEVYGEVTISDRSSRNDASYTFGNHFYSSLTLTNNSDYGNNYLSNGISNADVIDEDLTINNNSPVRMDIGIGDGEPLFVGRHVQLNSPYADAFYIDKITFEASLNAIFEVSSPGADPFEIRELYFRKNYEALMSLALPVKVTGKLLMGSDLGAIDAYGDNMLIIGDTCTVIDEDPVNGSFIQGPMKKIGNTAFTFPIGRIPSFNGRTKLNDRQSSENRKGVIVVYYKAPLSISAPTEPDASFIAEYFDNTPAYQGYDITKTGPGVGSIQEQEYWNLTRESGASNVSVTLSFNDGNIDDDFIPSSLQVVGWDGAKWIDWGNGGTTGTVERGSVVSGGPLTIYGPLALAVTDVRKPIIAITPFDSLVCVSSQLMVHFTLDTSAVEGNTLRVQLSDKDGSFSSGTIILNSKTTNHSDSILVTIPSYLIPGSQYRIRIISTQQGLVSENTPLLIPQSRPQGTFTIQGQSEVCMGTGTIKYYPSEKEEGVTYNWTVTKGTFTVVDDTAFVTFTSSGTAIVKITPTNNCGNGSVVSRNITVKPGIPTATPELTNVGRWLYASAPPGGQTVTFYNWYQNGTFISGAQNSTYYAPDAGIYTVEYANECGNSPVSNTVTFANASIPQTITFDNLPNKVFGDEPFSLLATSSSGLPVVYQIVSGPGNVTAGVYTITYSGTVVIKAYQSGDNQYDTAAPVTKSFVISKASQTITFDSIPDYEFKGSTTSFYLTATSTSGRNISYISSSPNISLYNTRVNVNGLGNVTITASQPGDTNYLPATSVTRTFCVRVMKLNPITGAQYLCPGSESVYKTNKINGLTYSWRLSDGTTFPSNADTIKITWPTTGNYKLIVSATGPCGPATQNDTLSVTVLDATVAPVAVTNMIPANNSIDQKLPLVLSWIPGNNTLSYDIYVWDNGESKPAVPFVPNITAINYTLPKSSLDYDKTYNWQVVSKNGCLQTNGSVQTFTLRKLPDLAVSEVQVPATANSGQNITINWKVKNIGGGVTTTNESWNDAVFLSFDTIPQFTSIVTGGTPWSIFDFPVKPMLIGTKKNVAALGVGEEYTNSIDVTLPRDVSQPLYVYVITNYNGGATAPLDANRENDTARAADPIAVTLTPTPDLRVDTVLAPATIFSGSTINVTYKVTNYGVLTPSGKTWKDKIYISKSPLFNKQQATALQAPKPNETYYRSSDIIIGNSEQLEHDESITNSLEVVIPNFISGTWFIHVVTNDGGLIYEGALANNNENNRPIQVILTPTPQFSISSVNLPITQLSTTQPVGINWNVTNTGLYDNIEKNKGFYGMTIGTCTQSGIVYGGRSASGNSNSAARGGSTGTVTETIYPLEHDSLSWGSSYWIDKIYLSTDPSGLNTGNALYLGQATKGIKDIGWQMPDNIVQSQTHCGPGHGNVPGGTTSNVLSPGSNHPNNFNFKVPGDLPEGDYYFYIQTNSTKTVFTYPDVPVIARSEKVTVSWPDLIVPSVTVPTDITGGSSFDLEYSVDNNGPGAVYEAARVDKIYVSNSSVFDGSATLIKTVNVTGSIGIGEPVTQSVTLSLPYGASRTQYFFVETNASQSFKEKTFGNNVSNAAFSNVTSAPAADLEITSVTVPGNVEAPGVQNVKLFYTVKNNSANDANGETKDSIYISCNPVFNQSTAFLLATNKITRSLAAGASQTDSVNIFLSKQAYLLNSCFTKADISSAYFFVKTNGNEGVYEAGNTANNLGGSGEKVIVNRNVDLVISAVTGAADATVGRPYIVDWEITNIANNSPVFTSSKFDSIYFSKDPVFNENAIGLYRFMDKRTIINPLTPVHYSNSFLLPKIDAGDYYVYVYTNATNNISTELNRSNNINFIKDEFGAAKKVNVVQPLLSDLVTEIVSAPASVAVGQPFTYTYRVSNTGAGVTYPDKWNDEVWLNTGIQQNPREGIDGHKLSSKIHSGNLEAGTSYEVTETITIPINTAPGNYLLSGFVDKGNAVVENIDSNNIGWRPITVYVPAPSDLIVESVTVPDTVYLGYTIDTLKWSVKNNSSNLAKGVSTDGIYLSANTVFDSSAVLIGIKNKDIDLNPLASATMSMTPIINNVPEGNYNVIVRTDLLNNIFESDKTNNENHTTKQVYVSVKELHLDITESDVLKDARYYKLVIPDSLAGSTILVTLKSEDSLSVLNEMYVGKGYVPSVTSFDYKFNTPNYGNQQILITDVTASVYYISIRCVTPNPPAQNITLNAVKLPFAVLYVQSNKGGNGGNVTVKLTGSLFADSMSAVLSNVGTTINATKVYFVNSTLAYATFPLQGKAIGVYDVILTKTDHSEAILDNGFSVVSPDNGGLYSGGGVNTGASGPGTQPGCDPGTPAGLNSQLVTEMVIPENVFAGWPFVIQINYSNPTNMDIPVQTRILYNDKGLPMSFTRENVAAGNTSSLYLELSEVDGPPGVFRAGSSGTITIYTVAPVNTPAHTYVKFNLK